MALVLGRARKSAPRWPAAGEGSMRRLNVVELKNSLGEVLNRAEYQGERIIVHRRGKDSAAIISIEDLRLFERLLENAEDRLDIEAARVALAESDERIPYEAFRRRQGLSDEPKPKKRRSTRGAVAKTV
jgi:prevent-host-death family protein